ncbi:hypothetical protein IIA16_02200 [bacterium]|nr:hypothetical protein [bacterium]
MIGIAMALVVVAVAARYGWKGFALPFVFGVAGFLFNDLLLQAGVWDWDLSMLWHRVWLNALIGLLAAVAVAWLLERKTDPTAALRVLKWGGVAALLPIVAGIWASLAGPTHGAMEIAMEKTMGVVHLVELHLWTLAVTLASSLGLLLLLEGVAAAEPRRRLMAGTVVAAFAWLAAATVFAGGLRFPAPQGTVFTDDEIASATYAEAVSPTQWALGLEEVYPGYDDGLAEYLAEGRAVEPVPFSLDTPHPYFTRLLKTPMGPAFDYLLSFREAHLENSSAITGLVTGRAGLRRPLTAKERERWLGLVLGHPTSLHEDRRLLANLVNAGNKAVAQSLLAHIDGVVARIPPGWDAEPDPSDLEDLEWLRGRIDGMPGWDGVERSLRLVLLGPTGQPLAGTPVGIWQAGEVPVEGTVDNGLPVNAWMSARYLRTDINGEARFSGLGPVAYGVVAIGGWQGGAMPKWGFAMPQTPLPAGLPPGETVVVLMALPLGYYGQEGDSGPYLLDSLPVGRLVAKCWRNPRANWQFPIGDDCGEEIELTGRALPESGPWAIDQPMIVEVDDQGRPLRVWVPVEGRKAETEHSLVLSPVLGESAR